jgi:hypothetical protein
MNQDLKQQLQSAIAGLTYMSESDEPFELCEWPETPDPLDHAKLLEMISRPPDTKVEEISFEDFFDSLTTDEDWYREEDSETVKKYRHLKAVLLRNLFHLRVFRVGEVEVDIYIVGQTPDGAWAGIKTKSVET